MNTLTLIMRWICILACISQNIFVPMVSAETDESLSIHRNIIFPVLGSTNFGDDFGDPRTGHTHEGNDIFGKKMQPLVSAIDGIVEYVSYPQASWGYSISLRDTDGYEYVYIHINNDTPGTDDGNGGGMHAYNIDLARGAPVVKGQLIGWLGDSGNAEGTTPHLHFEIRTPDGMAIDPRQSLLNAHHLSKPTPYPALPEEFLPYGDFNGGASLAIGHVYDTSTSHVITGANAGGGPHIKISTLEGQPVGSFFAYEKSFRGGVSVATGDMDGDQVDEIITCPGAGRPPLVKIFSTDGVLRKSFTAYAPLFTKGCTVTTADLNGDGKKEIIVAPRAGGGPHIRIFSGGGVLLSQFFAYDTKFRGGVSVAAGDIDSDGIPEIFTAAGPGGGPHVRTFSPDGVVRGNFFAYDNNFRGGVHIAFQKKGAAAGTILTTPASNGGPEVRTFQFDGQLIASSSAFEPWWIGGYTIATDSDDVFIASGPGRRTSIRHVRNDPDYWRW